MKAPLQGDAIFLDHDAEMFGEVLDVLRFGHVAGTPGARLLRELRFFGVFSSNGSDFGRYLRDVARESKAAADAARFLQEAESQFRDCCHKTAAAGRFEIQVTTRWESNGQVVVFGGTVARVTSVLGITAEFKTELAKLLCERFALRLSNKLPDGSFTLSWAENGDPNVATSRIVQILEACTINNKFMTNH